jgi:hypothetical protein
MRGMATQCGRDEIELLTRPVTVGKAGNLVEDISRSLA